MSQQEPDEAELRAALEEQMRRITVQDVLIQTVVTLINLGGRRLGLAGPPEEAGDRDLEQARLAIEGVRALLPILEQLDAEQMRPIRDALSQLQMAYAQLARTEGAPSEAGDPGAGAAREGAPAAEPGPSRPQRPSAGEPGGLWVPPGTKT
jgi:hypothetical protein